MNDTQKQNIINRDHYKAALENGSLMMIPYCACGNMLNEDYFCETCNRRCHCFQVVCDTSATLDLVQKYIRESPQFAGFSAALVIAKQAV